jgi:hypothetical protein
MSEHRVSDERKIKRIKHIDTYSTDTYSLGEGNEQIEGVMGVLYTIAFFAFLVGLYYLASKMFHIFTYLNESISNRLILAQFVALGTLVCGISLYFLREHRRMLYALLEMAFAIITGGATLSKLKDGDLSVWLALAAATYLVVRSLENMHKAGFTFIDTCNNYLGKHVFSNRRTSGNGVANLSNEDHKS